MRPTQDVPDVPVRRALPAGKARQSKGQARRRVIVKALQDLVLAKGYAEIGLTDLAEEVGMSVSHLLYYFDSKEAVLEELARKLNARFMAGIAVHSSDSPLKRIEALVDYIFASRGRPGPEYKLTAEMAALSMNRPKIRKLITEFNQELGNILTTWFQDVPRPSGISAEDAAERTRAALAGFVNNAQFDARLGVKRVHRLLRLALMDILGVRTLPGQNDSKRAAKSLSSDHNHHAIARPLK